MKTLEELFEEKLKAVKEWDMPKFESAGINLPENLAPLLLPILDWNKNYTDLRIRQYKQAILYAASEFLRERGIV